jgi:hypothetical protein
VTAIANLVLETSSSDGADNFTLAALNGKRTFAAAFSTGSTHDVFWYFISNSNASEWEWGTGHMSDATTLVRDTVIGSSNANAAVNFSDGVKYIGNDLPAENQIISNSGVVAGQIYGLAMTNTGELFGLSVRNAAVTGTSIYTPINVTTVNLQDGLQSVLVVPSTATVDAANGIGIYFQNNAIGAVNTVGLFIAGQGNTTNSPIWGINTLLTDNATRVTHSRTGQILTGWEADFNVMGASTQVIGISIGGNSLAQPVSAQGFVVNSLSGASPGTYKWTVGFITQDACASLGLVLGASVANGTSAASQPAWWLYFDSGSVRRAAVLTASDGIFNITNLQTALELSLGTIGGVAGSVSLSGLTSGKVKQVAQSVAGTPTITWGTSSGTPAISVPSPLSLSTTTGAVTWFGLTSGGVLYASDTTSVGSSALLTQYGILYGGGAGNPPVSVAAMTDGQLLVGQTGAAPLPKTLSSDATLSAAGALTLASTIAAGGPTGSATVAPIITYDAKGRLTTVSSATITPAVGSVTGLGTGVATALGVNVGSAGAFITFGGALGSPSSAGTIPAHTLGGTISGGGNQINNVIIGTSTPLAGAFTTLSATGQITSTLAIGTAPFAVTSTTQVANLYVARAALADAAAIGTITGLGTGVATALAVNVGTAGAPVILGGALGSPSSAGTIPAHTLGGTISGGGNQINNVIIGTSTPLAGTFTSIGTNSLVVNGSTSLGAGASLIVFTPTITNTGANVFQVNSNALFNGSGNNPIGYANNPQFIPSSSIAVATGGIFSGYASPSTGVTITDAYAVEVFWQFTNDAGAVTRAHALYVAAPTIFGALKPTTYYGVHVANQGASGITTSYGLYIDAQSGSATNIAFNNADTLDATTTTAASTVLAGGLAAAKAIITGTNLWHPTIANALVATVLGSLGPTGSHTTVQEWFPIKNAAGTIRYVPGF